MIDLDNEIYCPFCDYIYGPYTLASINASPNSKGVMQCEGCKELIRVKTQTIYRLVPVE